MFKQRKPVGRRWVLEDRKGMILPLSLIFLLILTLMGIAAVMTSSTGSSIMGGLKRVDEALYLAELGTEEAKKAIAQRNPNFDQVYAANGLIPGLGSSDEGKVTRSDGSYYYMRILNNEDDPGYPSLERDGRYIIHCTAVVGDTQKSLEVIVEAFSRFFYFTEVEDAPGVDKTEPWDKRFVFFITGDNLDGPVHSNGGLHIAGTPVFWAQASSNKVAPYKIEGSGSDAQIFRVTPNWNRYVALPVGPDKTFGTPDDLNDVYEGANAKGAVIDTWLDGVSVYKGVEHRVHFKGATGIVVYRGNQEQGSTAWEQIGTYNVASGFNGVLYFHGGGIIHVGGRINSNGTLNTDLTGSSADDSTVNGRWTICSGLLESVDNTRPEVFPAGPMWIDGDIKYEGTYGSATYGDIFPIVEFTDTDGVKKEKVEALGLLGLVSGNNVTIQNTPNIVANGVTIHASVMATNGEEFGSFMAREELVNGTNAVKGDKNVNLMGGIIQYNRGVMGSFETVNAQKTGLKKNYKYDTRLFYMSPPSFPVAVNLKTRSWRD